MIFVDTGFFFALSATDEKERHRQARELLETLQGRILSDVLITTDHIVFETLTLIQTTLTRNAHAHAAADAGYGPKRSLLVAGLASPAPLLASL